MTTDTIDVYWDEDFGGVMTTDRNYGVQLVPTVETLYQYTTVFVEGWVHDSDCVCYSFEEECTLDDIPSNVIAAMKIFVRSLSFVIRSDGVWWFDDGTLIKFDEQEKYFVVYNDGRYLGRIFPESIKEARAALDKGHNPVVEEWKDRRGKKCSYIGWN